jgi:tRNA pseudouridine65 synthase
MEIISQKIDFDLKEEDILYRDEFLVLINKAPGLMVHRSRMSGNEEVFALQLLRDYLGQQVYPIHRLDRKTSGVLAFALNKEVLELMNDKFRQRETVKKYVAIVRGFVQEPLEIDYALTNDKGKIQEAQTKLHPIQQFEIPWAHLGFPTSRYSLVELTPLTGRYHQLRKHMAHVRHPIIGDRPHGCNKQNRLWLAKRQMGNMLLHAKHLNFIHPVSNERLNIRAEYSSVFQKTLEFLKPYEFLAEDNRN